MVAPDGSVALIELGRVRELEALAEEWRAALGTAPPGAPDRPARRGGESAQGSGGAREQELGRALRERLLEPLLAVSGGATTWFVCLADFVHALPLEALPLGGGVVGDQITLVNTVSMRRFLAPAEALPGDGEPAMLAVGGVDFDAFAGAPALIHGGGVAGPGSGVPQNRTRSFHRLRGTEEEVRCLEALFGSTFGRAPEVLMEAAASKAAFHRHAPGKRFLHVATHGWFEEVSFPDLRASGPLWTPLDANEVVRSVAPLSLCGLALAGANRGCNSLGRVPGILTAEELAGVDLSACELAVLSGCETHAGLRSAGLGIQSLQTALHTAGVRTAITSLWRVDDDATRELMERFYSYLWVEQMSKAEALWKAKCDLRSDGHPKRHWAAWVLSGDPE